jgi:hypothetical protein
MRTAPVFVAGLLAGILAAIAFFLALIAIDEADR